MKQDSSVRVQMGDKSLGSGLIRSQEKREEVSLPRPVEGSWCLWRRGSRLKGSWSDRDKGVTCGSSWGAKGFGGRMLSRL